MEFNPNRSRVTGGAPPNVVFGVGVGLDLPAIVRLFGNCVPAPVVHTLMRLGAVGTTPGVVVDPPVLHGAGIGVIRGAGPLEVNVGLVQRVAAALAGLGRPESPITVTTPATRAIGGNSYDEPAAVDHTRHRSSRSFPLEDRCSQAHNTRTQWPLDETPNLDEPQMRVPGLRMVTRSHPPAALSDLAPAVHGPQSRGMRNRKALAYREPACQAGF